MYKNETLYRFFAGIFAKKNYGLAKVGSEKTGLDEEKKRMDEEANNLFNGNCKFRYIFFLVFLTFPCHFFMSFFLAIFLVIFLVIFPSFFLFPSTFI